MDDLRPPPPVPALLPGLVLDVPRSYRDDRGAFREIWHGERGPAHGLPAAFVQVNHSTSVRDTVRGLHFQRRHPQGKLVSVVSGAIWDVAVDVRPGSPAFGRHVGLELSAENGRQLYLPPGFAHGFCALSERAEVVYLTTDFYHPEDEGAIRWDDPTLGIRWPLAGPARLSAKDAAAPFFAEFDAAGWPTP